jgi:hypothetical protein
MCTEHLSLMAFTMAIINEYEEIGTYGHLSSNLLHLAINCELAVDSLNHQIFQFLRQLKLRTLYLL